MKKLHRLYYDYNFDLITVRKLTYYVENTIHYRGFT